MADWSSLPGDLINRIADCVLATDDLDYYMDLRAVCRGWRSSTADPKTDSARFVPRQWVMLDEVHQSDARLFVNPTTGRFVRKDLPLLRRYHLIADAIGGSLVLAERSPPHAVRLLNPFTGSLTRFAAPVPSNVTVAHVIRTGCSPPKLVLFCELCYMSFLKSYSIHWAYPDSEMFSSDEDESIRASPLVSHALVGGIYAAALELGTVSSSLPPPEAAEILMSLVSKPFAPYFSNIADRCFLVGSAGEILIVFKLPHRIGVFKIGDNMVVHPVKSIGRRALFIGNDRCLSVDADKFLSVDANSVYYVETVNSMSYDYDDYKSYDYDVRVYSLNDDTELSAGGAIGSSKRYSSNYSSPFSIVQLLSFYAYEVRTSQLGSQQDCARMVSMMNELSIDSLGLGEIADDSFLEYDD